MSKKTKPAFPRNQTARWQAYFDSVGRKYHHFVNVAVSAGDIQLALLRVARALRVGEVEIIGRSHARAEKETFNLVGSKGR